MNKTFLIRQQQNVHMHTTVARRSCFGDRVTGAEMGFWGDLTYLISHGKAAFLARAEADNPPVREWKIGLRGEGKRNHDGSSRQKNIQRCREGDLVTLVRESDNPHDENAILVCSADGGLGYIPADQAERLATEIDAGVRFRAYIAHINGGDVGKPLLGVVIMIQIMGPNPGGDPTR